MTLITFALLLIIFAFFAGVVGALTGLGGGVIIIPTLVLVFGVDIHYAMGASLISVIATSSGSATAYLKEGYTNLRIGLFLETVTVVGALIGAMLAAAFSQTFLAIIFSLILFLCAFLTLRRQETQETFTHSHPWAIKLKLDGTYPVKHEKVRYHVQHVPAALSLMSIAGLFSGLLGIGSGIFKVLAMDQALRLPYKVATTTSNFMIGITAAVGAGIYFANGYIDPVITFPVMLGVIAGAIAGARILPHLHTRFLRIIFSIAVCFVGAQMLYKALSGSL